MKAGALVVISKRGYLVPAIILRGYPREDMHHEILLIDENIPRLVYQDMLYEPGSPGSGDFTVAAAEAVRERLELHARNFPSIKGRVTESISRGVRRVKHEEHDAPALGKGSLPDTQEPMVLAEQFTSWPTAHFTRYLDRTFPKDADGELPMERDLRIRVDLRRRYPQYYEIYMAHSGNKEALTAIATRLGMSYDTVKHRWQRARKFVEDRERALVEKKEWPISNTDSEKCANNEVRGDTPPRPVRQGHTCSRPHCGGNLIVEAQQDDTRAPVTYCFRCLLCNRVDSRPDPQATVGTIGNHVDETGMLALGATAWWLEQIAKRGRIAVAWRYKPSQENPDAS